MNRRSFLSALIAVPAAAIALPEVVPIYHPAYIAGPIRGKHFHTILIDDLVNEAVDHEVRMTHLRRLEEAWCKQNSWNQSIFIQA